MVKTTIYLTPELKNRLERVARRNGRSEADVIRAAIEDYTTREGPRPRLPLFTAGAVKPVEARDGGADPLRRGLIILDASGLFAALVPDESQHFAARRGLEEDSPPFIGSPFVLGEVDYLLARRSGPARELEFLGEVWRGACCPPHARTHPADAT